jgi:putative spermidine/putrescine transport system substrate-binding protein
MTRRAFGAALAGTAATTLMPRLGRAATPVVAATFPGGWEDAYRRVLTPMLTTAGYDLTIAPALAQDQLAKTMASPGKPPYDALLMSPGQTAVAIANGLIEKVDTSKIPNWNKLDPSLQNEWGPTVTIEVNGIAYNPDMVPRPKGYRDLFENPAYAGKLSWTGFGSNTGVMAYTEIAKIFGKGPDDMEAVFKLFRGRFPAVGVIADSTNHQMTLYQQGEIAVFMCSTNNVARLKSLGLKSEFVHPETGSPAVPVNLHLTKGAANPAGVYAYMDAAISKAAQDQLKLPPSEQVPTNVDVAFTPGIEAYVKKEQLKSFVYPDWALINKNRDAWIKDFDRIIKA